MKFELKIWFKGIKNLFLKNFFNFYFLIEKLIYNIVLVSGVQHNDLIFIYII